jgi:hypothetical protein
MNVDSLIDVITEADRRRKHLTDLLDSSELSPEVRHFAESALLSLDELEEHMALDLEHIRKRLQRIEKYFSLEDSP